jgi:3-oxoadipate enol-lactonase
MSVAVHHQLDGPPDAPVLVLTGSLGTSLEMWADQVPALAEHFRLLRYDKRGHGRSPVPRGPYSVDDLGGDLLALLDGLRIERASLCGLSIGGLISMWVAITAPERVERLALCSTSAHLASPEQWTERAATVRAHGTEAVADAVLGRWLTPPFAKRHPEIVERLRSLILATPDEGYAGSCEALAAADLRGRLASIKAPTLVLTADQDPATPADEHGRAIAEAIPSARFQLISDGAHLVNVERPELFNAALTEHLLAEART